MRISKMILASFAASLLLGIFTIDGEAQTRRKKKKPVRRASVVVAPAVPSGDAQIISRASDQNLLDPQALNSTVVSTNEPVADTSARYIEELTNRIKQLEGAKTATFEDRQKRLLLNLDIITRAEQRSESLRKQLFEMIEKETNLRSRIDQIDADARPEAVERVTIFGGSLRPEEVREARRKSLQAEKSNLTALVTQIQTTRASLERNLERSDQLIDRLRFKLE
ncbi:MAG: hypothetical protein H0X08_09640, partial [Blastocatellia bacterium]|nr:hypothetical protein [Blastocatellia bacterium]